VALIPPRPPLSGDSRELFPRKTGYLFDPVAAAGTASILSLQVLLDPKRAARLNQLAAVSGGGLNFPAVLDALFKATWVDLEGGTALNQLIAQQTQRQTVDQLVLIAAESGAASAVRAEAWDALNIIKGHVEIRLDEAVEADAVQIKNIESWRAHYWFIGQQIAAAASANKGWRQAESLVPPGSPI
jgi:hypothetical protein